jgi:secretion/DNA translocation related TadE-like protein
MMLGATGLVAVTGATSARWRAQTAADLAALAAAQAGMDGLTDGQACNQAGLIAKANGAQLASCGAVGQGRFRVAATASHPALSGQVAKAQAVAGPERDPPAGQAAGRVSDQQAGAVLAWARAQLGKPYVWGGNGPDGFDCSGLVQQAYAHAAGQAVPRTAQAQYDAATKVAYSAMRPGDLIFWTGPSGVHHVAVYAGDGQMVEAPRTGLNVRQVPIRWAGTTPMAGRY